MARREIQADDSLLDARQYLVWPLANLAAAAKSEPELAKFAAAAEKALAQWDAVFAASLAGWDGITKANAVVRLRDAEAGEVIAATHNGVLAHVNLNRKALLFLRFFPKSLSVVLKLHLGRLVETCKELVLALGVGDTPKALVEAHTKPLQGAINNGAMALDGRIQAEVTRDAAASEREKWRLVANGALKTLEADLQKHAVAKGRQQAWTDAFFVPPVPVKKKAAAAAPVP